MKWTEAGESACPVQRTAAIVGDRWTLLILREALLGARRFDEFQAGIGCSPHLLSVRLKRLVAEDILTREGEARPVYRLTAAGRDLQPLVLMMGAWGNRWRGTGGEGISYRHQDCGAAFRPVVGCSECGEPVGLRVEAVLAPGLYEERQARISGFRARSASSSGT